jgi:YidC/Oxa1 family membrane protein insertase
VSEQEKKKNLTPELRILVASLLSMGVILLWARFFAPKPPIVPPQTNRPAQSAPPSTGPAATSAANPALPHGTATAVSAAAPVTVSAKSDVQERTIVVENDLYRVEFSNHGGVVKSWQLKHYMDDAKPPRVLDVVHPDAATQTGGWPFAVVLDDAQLESEANAGLYQISSAASSLSAPADVEFSWSDGHLEVTKRFHFDHSYVVRAETSVKLNGAPSRRDWRGSAASAI